MTIALAITDFNTTLAALTWLEYVTEQREPGRSAYTLTATTGAQTTVHNYGARKIQQDVSLTLTVKTGVNIGVISGKLDTINQALIADRRRSGYAQTTIVGEWTVEDNAGREGLTLTMDAEVHVYES